MNVDGPRRRIAALLLGLIPGLLVIAAYLYVAPALSGRGQVAGAGDGSRAAPRTRPAVVAGRFYPREPAELRGAINGLLAKAAKVSGDGDITALIVPHAGYTFSGPVAAEAFAQVKGERFATVVVVGPSHHVAFRGAAVYDGDFYQTPLGRAPIDKELVQKLMRLSPAIRPIPEAERQEHSVEVEVPWLQQTIGRFKLVSLIVGEQDQQTAEFLGKTLAAAVEGRKVLIVASVDLSHYYPYDQAVALDHVVAQTVADMDEQALFKAVAAKTAEPDAPAVIGAVLGAAKRLGADKATILKLANSGDITGDKSKVVGYLAAVLYRPRAPSYLSAKERRTLLKIAREAIYGYVNQGRVPKDIPPDARLRRPGMAFVTLTEGGALRGCIGFTEPSLPLYESVRQAAVSAAVRDSRFRPVSADELDKIKLEISVLNQAEPLDDISNIKIGRDGLILTKGGSSGLFLPQVPVAQGWDTTTYLEELGVKAGLDRQAWQNGAVLQRFEAEVFGE